MMSTSSAIPGQHDRDAAARSARVEALREEIAELASHIHAATYRLLALIRELDAAEGWGSGFRSAAHWLSWRTGIDLGAAREKVRVARALATLPQTSAALANGSISYAKVRAMTRVATPESEHELLVIARHGTAAHVERVVRSYRRVSAVLEGERAQAQRGARALRTYWDDEGMLVVEGRLPPEEGARLLAALDAAEADVRAHAPADVSAETPVAICNGDLPPLRPARLIPQEAHAQGRADALVRLAEAAVGGGLDSHIASNALVVVHVDQHVLHNPCGADGRSAVENGPRVSAETSRRLSCDGSVVRLFENDVGAPIGIGRQTRAVPPSMRRALHTRDGGCRFPGCGTTRWLHAHHVQHWAAGGATHLHNLVELCTYHHRAVHEGGYRVTRGADGQFTFTDARGCVVEPCPVAPEHVREPLHTMMMSNRNQSSSAIGARTLTSWNGSDRLDTGLVVAALLAHRPSCAVKPASSAARPVASTTAGGDKRQRPPIPH